MSLRPKLTPSRSWENRGWGCKELYIDGGHRIACEREKRAWQQKKGYDNDGTASFLVLFWIASLAGRRPKVDSVWLC